MEYLYQYDLTTFQILGRKFVKFFVGILVQKMAPEGHFEINWPLAWPWALYSMVEYLLGLPALPLTAYDPGLKNEGRNTITYT